LKAGGKRKEKSSFSEEKEAKRLSVLGAWTVMRVMAAALVLPYAREA
jgi:hypothetical protein